MNFSLRSIYSPRCFLISNRSNEYYVQLQPHNYLNEFIYCYWAAPSDTYNKHTDLQSPQKEFIIPDGCTDIIFVIDKKTKEYSGSIYGPIDKPYLVDLMYDRFQVFGITFNPGGLHPFLGSALGELRNKIFSLEDVMIDTCKDLGSEISRANNISEMVNSSNRYFSILLNKHSVSDLLSNMLYKIYRTKGHLAVKDLSQSEMLCERQIRRTFDSWIGINPKTFSRIVRFQSVIKSTSHLARNGWVSLALEHGYYDEAHFFNEFKELCGISPKDYINII